MARTRPAAGDCSSCSPPRWARQPRGSISPVRSSRPIRRVSPTRPQRFRCSATRAGFSSSRRATRFSPRSKRWSRRRQQAIRSRSSPVRSRRARNCSSCRWPHPRSPPSPAFPRCAPGRGARHRAGPRAGTRHPGRCRPADRGRCGRQPGAHRAGAGQACALRRGIARIPEAAQSRRGGCSRRGRGRGGSQPTR